MESIPRSAYHAIIYGNMEEFLRHSAVYGRYEFISHVISYGTPEMLREIREQGALHMYPYLTAQVSAKGDVFKMNQLILAGHTVGPEELILASQRGNLAMVKYLLHFTGDRLDEAIEAASSWGHLKVVASLLDAGGEITVKALTNAYSGTYPDVVEYLISRGANPNDVDPRVRKRYVRNSIIPYSKYLSPYMSKLVGSYY